MAIQQQGLQQVFEENRNQLLRYLRAHGAGEAAEDLLQELWLKVSSSVAGPIASPRSYLFRAATNLMIDRRDPGPERALDGRRRLELVERALSDLPDRALSIFRQHRLEGRTQREIASAMGLSVSTVESDLRVVDRLLAELREKLDEE